MSTATTDLSDAFPHLSTAAPVFQDFGGDHAFCGQMATLKTRDDNVLIRTGLESAGEGRVLVVDNSASLRVALLGDMLAALAIRNGWAGIVINGCVRDSAELTAMPIGIKALAAVPRRSAKNGVGETGVDVTFADVTFISGQWLYADRDGILVSPDQLH